MFRIRAPSCARRTPSFVRKASWRWPCLTRKIFSCAKRVGQAKTNPFDPLAFGGEIHLTYFRPATFRSTLRAAGFEVLKFGVDDIYHRRDLAMRLKLRLQQILARTLGWHFAVAMYAVCRRMERPAQ